MTQNDKTPPDRAGHCQSCNCSGCNPNGRCNDTAHHPRSQAEAYRERIKAALARFYRKGGRR